MAPAILAQNSSGKSAVHQRQWEDGRVRGRERGRVGEREGGREEGGKVDMGGRVGSRKGGVYRVH